MIANLLDKQEKLYLVPSTKKENELLAGIILNDEIIYPLYNETNEPICDVKYDFEKQNIVIISNYGNDAIPPLQHKLVQFCL